MDALFEQLKNAKGNAAALNALLKDYIPFIKGQIKKTGTLGLEYDDALSIAMVAFASSVRQYDEARSGGFLSFAAVSIRNRLIDEARKQKRYYDRMVVENQEERLNAEDYKNSCRQYSKEEERAWLAEEISLFSEQLKAYQLSFQELSKTCPKQKKARRQCIALAKAIATDDEMKKSLVIHKKVAQSKLAQKFQISPKTIEKHRKYITAVSLLFLGDYPGICSFLPKQWGDDSI